MSWQQLVRDAAPEHADELIGLVTEAIAGVEVDDEAELAAVVLESWYEDDETEAVEAFDPAAHPRAAAGAANGGQFTAGGSEPAVEKGAGKKVRKGGEVLSYDPKAARGTGYGRKGGDPRVRRLQAALNRLGLTDSNGRKLVVDGKLGPKTTEAIKAAQRRLGVKADGKVTPQLLAKLVAAKSLNKTAAKASAKPVAKAAATAAAKARATKAKTTEAIGGQRSAHDTRAILNDAVTARARELSGQRWAYAYVCDFTDDQVVYEFDGKTWQAPYTLTEHGTTGTAQLGQPVEVVAQTWYVPADGDETDAPEIVEDVDEPAVESLDRIAGRVLEAKGTDEDGGRIFRVQIIEAGDSKNGRRYPQNVLESAVSLYEGAKAYDHHRTVEELRSGTISGLVGFYRNVEASTTGIDGDLHLLPGASHTAEALDASIAAQAQGLPPLVGISHDAMTVLKPIIVGGRRLQEATAITKVNSADVVSDPAAGGKATRVLAGGLETDPETDSGEETKESDVAVTTTDVLAALKTATPEDLAAVGLQRSSETTTTPPEPEGLEKTSFLGGLMIERKVEAAGLPATVASQLTASLPDRITESAIDDQIAALKSVLGVAERSGLAPTATAQVTKESREKVVEGLDKFFAGDFSVFRSFKQAHNAFTGYRPSSWGEDENRVILRESAGNFYDSATRSTESMTTGTWAEVLGDSVTRRMIAEYNQPSLQSWRQIVSDIVPVNDFRTQRRTRVGGYGTLPVVGQGAPYQPLTSPGDEEATYQLEKRGGTEDLTLEMVANDDVGAIRLIPKRLGLAAARTLHNFVWDFLVSNAAIYDGTALFHASHNNTTAVALSQSGMSSLRQKMRDQTGYGDSSNILSLVPKFLIVPNELEELAFQLCSSAVAIPATPAGPSDTPNLHRNMTPIVVDYFADPNDWFQVADPNMCPTIELGFYQGRQEPELFTQSDPSVGSVFNSDTITHKIRHVYKGAVVEFRGFQRATQ